MVLKKGLKIFDRKSAFKDFVFVFSSFFQSLDIAPITHRLNGWRQKLDADAVDDDDDCQEDIDDNDDNDDNDTYLG